MPGPNYRLRHKRQFARPLSPAESAFSSFLSAAASKASQLAAPPRATAAVPPAPPPAPRPPPPAVTPLTTTSLRPLITTMPTTSTKPPAKPASKSKAPASTKSAKATAKPVAGAHKGPSPAVVGVVVTICLLIAIGVAAFFLRKYLIKRRKQRREEKWANRPRTTFINTDKPGGVEEEIEPYTDRLRDSANTSEQVGDAFGGPQTGVPYYAEKSLPTPDDLQVLSYNSPASSLPSTPLNEKAPTLAQSLSDQPPSTTTAAAPAPAPSDSGALLTDAESQLFFTQPMRPETPKIAAGIILPASPPPVYSNPTADSSASMPNPHPQISTAVPAALLPGGVNRDSFRPASPAVTMTPAPLGLPTMRQGTEATMPTYTLAPGSETALGPTQPSTDPTPIATGTNAANQPAPSYAYTVIRTFAPTLPDELRITTGERVKICNSYDDGWALCENIGGQKGVVPLECLDLNLNGGSSNEEWRISRRASSLFGVTVNF